MNSARVGFLTADPYFLKKILQKVSKRFRADLYCSLAEVELEISGRAVSYDHFFVDLNVPDNSNTVWELSGLWAVWRVRKMSRNSDLKVTVLTEAGSPNTAYACLRNGADNFIEKNTSFEKFWEDVNCVLDRGVCGLGKVVQPSPSH